MNLDKQNDEYIWENYTPEYSGQLNEMIQIRFFLKKL